ncbi:hypothetical protein BAE44_0015942 [Dichanthelium oligosanthes]|uniref:Late embryogenesis abundant protein LEA-2 subgroup domain-containing protein n=1 Tax=Dichanthelium oligosanthes TaxID=888268 RepID=A0A1E5VD22_9POAL|nr:hypothetical protein BAE44_0015942 [Dichanthelium oligosanthes]
MTADGGEGDGEKSRFRCLDAARYVFAAAVTVLIMVVVVNAIKVVLRPESLQLSVAGGSLSTAQLKPPPEEVLGVELNLRAQNPSGRSRMYYLNIRAYLFDKNTSASASSKPEYESIITFIPSDIAVVQQEAVDSLVSMKLKKRQVDPSYFGMLYNGSRFSDMTLRLDGDLITEVTSEFNKTRPTSYYCEQLLVGGKNSDDEPVKYRQDVICKQRGALN